MKKLIWLAMIFIVIGTVAAATVDVDMDVDFGEVIIDSDSGVGTNAEARTRFRGFGGFVGNFNADDSDGIMDSLIGVVTKGITPWTRFEFDSMHNLGSSNNNDHKMEFYSWVDGETATMDIRIANSASQSQAERVSGRQMLSAADSTTFGYTMGYGLDILKRDDSNTKAYLDVSLFGVGTGNLGKTQYGSNHLARGVGYNNNALDVRDGEMSATGTGIFTQDAYGENSLEMNGFTFGSGYGSFIANFGGSLTGQYMTKAR